MKRKRKRKRKTAMGNPSITMKPENIESNAYRNVQFNAKSPIQHQMKHHLTES
jgi:hypothetical protein